MPNWSDDEGRCHFDCVDGPCYRSTIGCPVHPVYVNAKAKVKAKAPKPKPLCVVCLKPRPPRSIILCKRCAKEYDEVAPATLDETIAWAARTARYHSLKATIADPPAFMPDDLQEKR